MATMTNLSPTAGETPSGKNNITYIVGVAALIGFAILIIYLLWRAIQATDPEWTRAVYLLNGVEAIAFAASGFFFGKEVHRERAQNAENALSEAQEAKITYAQQATQAETKGKAIAGAIHAKIASQLTKAEAYKVFASGEAVQLIQDDLADLEALANKLFP